MRVEQEAQQVFRQQEVTITSSGEEGLELGKLDLARPVCVDLVDEVLNVYRQAEVNLDDLYQGSPEHREKPTLNK